MNKKKFVKIILYLFNGLKRIFSNAKKPKYRIFIILLLASCGRPKHYQKVAKIDFSGAASSKVLASFNLGVGIVAVYVNDRKVKRFFGFAVVSHQGAPMMPI